MPISKSLPEISIIIPVFNRAALIAESLDSIMNQSFQNWECIIIDDHSTDNSVEVINNYIKEDKRFNFFERPNGKNKGANSCRNFGLKKAKGKYIHWFDSDDIAHPKYLEISLKLIEEYKVDFCRFHRSVFWGDFHYNFKEIFKNPTIKEVTSEHIKSLLKNEIVFNTCNVLWRKKSLNKERFNEEIVYADEWEYYSRLLSNNLKGISIDSELFFGRKHTSSTTYEFANNDPIRRASKIKATKLVIENLSKKNKINAGLEKFFIRLGFQLHDYSIIQKTLEETESNFAQKMKYKLGYLCYPVIKPIFNIKSKLLKS